MYKIIVSCLVLFMACSQPSNEVAPFDLIGKTIEYTYGESIYHVLFDTESTLHWEAMTGDEKGIKANETYIAESVAGNIIFITWAEENGIGVSQILDFNKGIVYNHLIKGRKVNQGKGKIKLL